MVPRLPALSSIMAITTLSSWTLHVSLLFTGQLAVRASCRAYWLEPSQALLNEKKPADLWTTCPYALHSSEDLDALPTTEPVGNTPGHGLFDRNYVSCYYVANLDRCKDAEYDHEKVNLFTAKDPDTAKHEQLGIYCGRGSRVLQDTWRPDNARPGWIVSGWKAADEGNCEPIPQKIDPVGATWLQIKSDVTDVVNYPGNPYEQHQSADKPVNWSQLHPISTTVLDCFPIAEDLRCSWDMMPFWVMLWGQGFGIVCVDEKKRQGVPENALKGIGHNKIQWYWDEGKMSWWPYLF